VRLLTTYYPNRVPEMDTFVPCVAGIFLLVGGWKTMRWAGPAIAFLIFMFPLPGPLDTRLLSPLQKLATTASTYCLQTIGIPTYSEGNRIVIGEVQLGVVEACSGLRMLTIFVALAVAITLVTDRPWWERIVTIASAVPIALAVNTIRITVTGILHLTAGPELAEMVFHDLAGWFMMPMALGLLYVEFQILSHLVIDEGQVGPLQIAGRAGERAPAKAGV
jgi:exosortase